MMKTFLVQNEKESPFDSDDLVYYSNCFDEYGIIIHDLGSSYVKIEYCPWCGRKLPDSKRDLWFDILEKQGIENPLDSIIPEEFKSDAWWRNRNL